MNPHEKKMIRALRENGKSYASIAAELELSVNSIKAYCHRKNIISLVEFGRCPRCGALISPEEVRRNRRYCSDICRYSWNYAHRLLSDRNAVEKKCACCQRPFFSYPSSHRKYCSHDCYIADRYDKELRHDA